MCCVMTRDTLKETCWCYQKVILRVMHCNTSMATCWETSMAICWVTMKQTLKETCWCFLLLPPPSSLPPFPSLPLEFFDSNTLGEVVGDLPGLTDGDIKGNLMGLFDSNMLGEAYGNWLWLTDYDCEVNLLGLLTAMRWVRPTGTCLGLQMGTLKTTCWGSLMAMHWVMKAKMPLMATNPCLLSFFSPTHTQLANPHHFKNKSSTTSAHFCKQSCSRRRSVATQEHKGSSADVLVQQLCASTGSRPAAYG